MNTSSNSKALCFLTGLALLCAAPALAVDSGLGGGGQAVAPVAPVDAPLGPGANWIDHFDTYVTASQMHGQGGWKGWDNAPAAGALTSSTQARSLPNSVDVVGAADLVHEYAGYTTGTWTFTAWQYIPTGTTGLSYFILLNTYVDGGGYNWSTQVGFDGDNDTVLNEGPAGGSLPIVYDQWVEIRVVIDLDLNTQDFFYGGQFLYTDSWTEGLSGGGAVNIGAVDLFANAATSIFWDDISLSNLPFLDGFENESTSEWHLTEP